MLDDSNVHVTFGELLKYRLTLTDPANSQNSLAWFLGRSSAVGSSASKGMTE